MAKGKGKGKSKRRYSAKAAARQERALAQDIFVRKQSDAQLLASAMRAVRADEHRRRAQAQDEINRRSEP